MPNHVTNKLIITGPAASIAELVREVQGKEPEDFFSFNRLIPMPKILRETESGSRSHWGVIALGLHLRARKRGERQHPAGQAAGNDRLFHGHGHSLGWFASLGPESLSGVSFPTSAV